ncbi:MAG: hypothetical protein Q7S56_03170 [Nanoarchaeota archaeon]|nr:hypothetical protein [Nanoarchaeota archaeon]
MPLWPPSSNLGAGVGRLDNFIYGLYQGRHMERPDQNLTLNGNFLSHDLKYLLWKQTQGYTQVSFGKGIEDTIPLQLNYLFIMVCYHPTGKVKAKAVMKIRMPSSYGITIYSQPETEYSSVNDFEAFIKDANIRMGIKREISDFINIDKGIFNEQLTA